MKLRVIAVVAITLLSAALVYAVLHEGRPSHLRVLDATPQLPADGRFHRIGLLTATDGSRVNVSSVSVEGLLARTNEVANGNAELTVQAPVLPGDRALRIAYGKAPQTLRVHFVPSSEDNMGNGTPDFLRLHRAEDRSAFRGWFAAMAEAAADLPREKLPREIDDCAALLRWCYRNALHAHDEAWLSEIPPGLTLTQPSVRQYVYPLTPLGAALFRVRQGAFAASDANNGAFAQFADARTLWRLNTFFVSRDVRSAHSGDILFFRQLEQNSPYHSMIVTGEAQGWAIYHTGPIGRGPGEMRRVAIEDLLAHPDARWRPISTNSNFLGVYRWNILQEDPR